MSLNYINPKTESSFIRNRFSNIYPLFEQFYNQDEQLFIILNEISCLINVFYRNRTFSTTDCCSTVQSLWKLFEPEEEKDFQINDPDHLLELLNNHFNIFDFHISGLKIPYHNFLVLKHNNNFYLLQSYTNVCEMNIIKNNHLPFLLSDLLKTGSINKYNNLFKTNIPDNNLYNPIIYDITAGYFEYLPTQKLHDLILSYLSQN